MLSGEIGAHVEGREGGFVVVAEVVEEDGVGGCGGDGDHGRGRVVRGQVRGGEVQAGLRGRGLQVPEADGVVEGAGEEGVGARVQGDGGDGGGVAAEVAQEGVVVGGEVADAVVFFCAGVDDGAGVVGEAGEVGAVFLAEEGLDGFAFLGVVEEEGVDGGGGEEEFARVVEVERGDVSGGGGDFELLESLLAVFTFFF